MPFLTDDDIELKSKDKTEDVLSKSYSWQAIAKKEPQKKKTKHCLYRKKFNRWKF